MDIALWPPARGAIVCLVMPEDKATQACDLSAGRVPYGTGGIPAGRPPVFYAPAGSAVNTSFFLLAKGPLWFLDICLKKKAFLLHHGCATNHTQRNAMNNAFVAKHADKITGVLSCFDRVLFKGYLPIARAEGMEAFMDRQGVLRKQFKPFVQGQTPRLKEHAQAMCKRLGRPYKYLPGRAARKEDLVADILRKQPVERGLICVLSATEGCQSFKLAYGEGRPRLVNTPRKCLCLYFYFLDSKLGLMHVRVPTWFPFTVQVCVNGHHWLAKKMDRHHLKYQRLDNAFSWIEDCARAQRFADRFVDVKWPRILQALAAKVCPLFKDLLAGMDYYWVAEQAEYATDVLFRDRDALRSLYANLLRHATLCFSAEDVMTFLGRKLDGRFKGEAVTDVHKRWQGSRVKHRIKGNWIKMYDKHGLVLRIETVINCPKDFKVRRQGKRAGELVTGWFPMSKGVCNLYRYGEVCLASNGRYLQALAVVDDPAEALRSIHKLCQPAPYRGRKRRGLNPLRCDDASLLAACLRGEFAIHGFRNRDLAQHLVGRPSKDPAERRRQNARISRRIQLLRAHGLVAKVPRSRRYHPTARGRALMIAALQIRMELPAMVHRVSS